MNLPLSLGFSIVATLLPTGSPQAQSVRIQQGDTTLLRTTGNGPWGVPRDATEALRVSSESGPLAFGRIAALAATPAGGVVVLDGASESGPVLRVLDAQGKYLRTIGRTGAGPGEYSPQAASSLSLGYLSVTPSGVVLLVDRANSRIDRWTLDGKALSAIPLPTQSGGLPPVVIAGKGDTLFVRYRLPPNQRDPLRPAESGFLRLVSSSSAIDTLAHPVLWAMKAPATFLDPRGDWFPLPDGRAVLLRTDRLGLLLAAPNGRLTFAEKIRPPVPFLREERDEIQAQMDVTAKMNRSIAAAPPSAKPAMGLPALNTEMTMLWVELPAASRKVAPLANMRPPITHAQPPVFGAFRLDGTWLGELRFPMGAQYLTFGGGSAWGIVPDQDEVPVLIRWTLPR